MPYFRWTGVDIEGKTKKGYLSACSPQDLDDRLFRKKVALTSYKKRFFPLSSRIITMRQKELLYSHVAQLLRAGVTLPQALDLAAEQSTNPILHELFSHVVNDVRNGVLFAHALTEHKKIINPFMITMLSAGHEVGDSAQAFEYCAANCRRQDDFEKTVRASLAMPILTIVFFVVASIFIFTMIIPRFADMFASLQCELPSTTKHMIAISEFIRSTSMVMAVAVFIVCVLFLRRWSKGAGKKVYDRMVLACPFIGKIIYYYHVQRILHALALLMQGGVTLTKALALVAELESNYHIQQQIYTMYHAVEAGVLLSDAMEESGIVLLDVIALINIGQESGSLGRALEYSATIYSTNIDTILRRVALFIQPVLVLLLGILITCVIIAVYLPILGLSRVI